MKVKVAINGFGRIGRMVFRKAILDGRLDLVAINASHPAETLVHLIKYDSIHGQFDGEINVEGENALCVNGKTVQLIRERDPKKLPWRELNVAIVIEATGNFKSKKTASYHLEAGAQKVVITAPGKDEDITIVMGVNEENYDHDKHHIISNASCTTNCLAPVAKIIDENFGIETGLMTTIHSYTNDQKNIDNPHKDLRRARSCGQSIIPTTTGAAQALALVLPKLAGKMNGLSLRVPTPNVSLVDLVATVRKDVTADEVNQIFKEAAKTSLKGVLGFTMEPLVSIDFNGNENSSIVDGLSTMVIGKKHIKILAWYDNEWGYSCRVVDLASYVAKEIEKRAEVTVS
jgi:glyceraldehyde 3-phosphate dehydrogenase